MTSNLTTLEVVNNGRCRMVVLAEQNGVLFEATRVDKLVNGEWEEVVYWDHAEWEERGTEAFEAIIGCITRIANDEVVEVPLPNRASLPPDED